MSNNELTILEEKVVASGGGSRMTWVKVLDEEDFTERWEPRVYNEKGQHEVPLWMPLPGSQFIFLQCPVFEALYEGTRGPGKRLSNDFNVLTDSGWKRVGDVTLRDMLVAPDGTYTKIKGIYPHESGTMYRMTFDDGASIECDGDHLWSVRSAKNSARDGWLVRNTNQLIELLKQSKGKTRSQKNSWYIPTMSSPAPGKKWTGLDPYAIGLLLGDGTTGSKKMALYTCDNWIKNYMVQNHNWLAYDYRPKQNAMMVQARCDVSEEWKDAVGRAKGAEKKISQDLLDADPRTRLACLQGLMDSDGSIDKEGRCSFTSISEHLAFGVQYLARSLGGKSTVSWDDREPTDKGGQAGRWRVQVMHCNKFNPFRLPRKVERVKPMKGVDRRIISIEPAVDGPATCFEVEHPSHLFICQDFIVTHNTLTLIMDFAKDVGKGHGGAWRGVLFRRTFGDLDDVVRKIEEWFPQLYPGFIFLKSKAEYAAVWPTGEKLLLRHMKDENDYGEYHGHEYPWIGWEELTQWSSDKAYKLMMSCCRPPKSGVPCRIRATTNPYGCVPYGDVLTVNRGWVPIQEVKDNEMVWSSDDTGCMIPKPATLVVEDHDGVMVSRKGRGLTMEFTEHHSLPRAEGAGFRLQSFDEMPGQVDIRRTVSSYEGSPVSTVDVSAFLGWYIAEGSCVPREKALVIAQQKSEECDVIRAILDRMEVKYRYDGQQFWVYDKTLYKLCSNLGKSYTKYIPVRFKNSSRAELSALLDALMVGDGSRNVYYTVSRQLADDVSEIAVKLGYSVYINSRCHSGFKPDNPSEVYQVNLARRDVVQLNTGNHIYDVGSVSQSVNIERTHHVGEVYCLEVPDTNTFFIRQNGCVWLSGNTGHNWVKRRFQLPQMRGQIIRKPGELPRVAIHGTLSENFLLLHDSPNYPIQIREAATNAAQAEAWLDGSWDVTAGGMIDDLWNDRTHVLPPIPVEKIPHGWSVTRAYDHGQSSPFACGWFLESNGEPIEVNGRLIGNVRGDIVLWQEWYGTKGGENEGVRLAARKIGAGIHDREIDLGLRMGDWCRVTPGPADTEIFNKASDRDGRCPADDMEEEGVFWERADKSSGSRKRGWEMLRTYLQDALPNPDGSRERPGFFVCSNCTWWLHLCPPMPRDEKDLDEVPDTYEDHMADMTRYRLNWEVPGMWRRGF